MNTLVGEIVSLFVSLLVRWIVTPPAGAGEVTPTTRVAVSLRPRLADPLRVTRPGGSTLTVAVASGIFGAFARIMVVPGATAVTRAPQLELPSGKKMLGMIAAIPTSSDFRVKVMPP